MNAMAASGQSFYEEDEAEQILNLAASMSSQIGKMSHDRLLETAAELGISREAVEAAERQVTIDRKDKALRKEFDDRQRRELIGHLTSYLVVNAFLLFINLRTTPWHIWAIWPMLGWGIGLVAHANAALFKSSESYRGEFDRWRERRGEGDRKFFDPKEVSVHPRGLVIGVHVGSAGKDRERRRRSRLAELDDEA